MRERLVTLCLAVGCAAFFAVSVIITISQDKTAPVITIEDKDKEITYRDGDDYEELLSDVTARDNRDGDVTDQIFIDSIKVASDGNRAIVQYAVIDKSNNVGTATRIINYEGSAKAEEEITQPETESAEEEKAEEEKTQEAEETAAQTSEQNTEEQQAASADNETEEESGELTPNGTSPAIRLTESSRTIRAGESFDVLSVVDQVVDDQDDESVLSRRIHADGEYNTSVPGTYTIRYYVMDTNNNTSNIEEFTLTVQ